MRVMNQVKGEFEDRGVEFLAVSVFEDAAAAREFADGSSYEFDWAHMEIDAAERIGVASVPSLIVVDGDGKVAWRSNFFTPFRGGGDLRAALTRLTGG